MIRVTGGTNFPIELAVNSSKFERGEEFEGGIIPAMDDDGSIAWQADIPQVFDYVEYFLRVCDIPTRQHRDAMVRPACHMQLGHFKALFIGRLVEIKYCIIHNLVI